jgi:hypothetical protein
VAEQRALLTTFESAKEADDVARARMKAEEEQLRRALELSIQRALTEEAGRRLFAEERQRLLEDAPERRALFAGIRRMRRAAVVAEQRKSEGGDTGTGLSTSSEDSE